MARIGGWSLHVAAVLLASSLAACGDSDGTASTRVNEPSDSVLGATTVSPPPSSSSTVTAATAAATTTTEPSDPSIVTTTIPDVPSVSTTAVTSTSAAPSDPLLVTTTLGAVRGAPSTVEGVRAFHAIPYAEAPTGDNRWRPPRPRVPSESVFDATRPGGTCPQVHSVILEALTPFPDAVEDCLTVSVWAPADAVDLPVMFWIHGGSNREGSAQQVLVAGDDLAANGAVVVGVNFRLGAFGFLATEELAEEDPQGAVGNYALLDQVAALEWVEGNIAAFGGDPDNVTIFGQSSGAHAVCAHLASPRSQGLFDKAIVQSDRRGTWFGCDRYMTREVALADGEAFLASVGCTDVSCLRARPTAEILAVQGEIPEPDESGISSFVADGVILDDTAVELAARGALDGTPILIGSNGTEARLHLIGTPEPTAEELPALFAEETGRPDELLALYPQEQYPTPLDRYATMATDVWYACPTVAFAETSTTTTFVYQWDYVSPSDPFGLGPTHGSEAIMLFNHPEGISGLTELTGVAAQLSAQMQEAWVAFARTGDPGDLWEPYADQHRVTSIDDPIALVDEIRDGRCDAVRELTDR